MSASAPKILMAAGGTGGHLYPALAIAERIRHIEPNAVIWFAGTSTKIESRVVPQVGYSFHPIWISGLHRSLRLSNLLFPIKVLVSLVQSFFLIKKFSPDVVVGTGGYVCGPVLFAANLLGVPTVLHESNSYPGATTRLLAARATRVFLAFQETRKWLRRSDNTELVGTPTRDELGRATREQSLKFFGLDRERTTVLVFGGSLGSASINSAVLGMVDQAERHKLQFIWQTGTAEFDNISRAVASKNIGWVGPFIDRMEDAYGAADVVICRAGALTIAELMKVGLPAILVPYPHAAADHQTLNAMTLVEVGAALMIPDRDAKNNLPEMLFNLVGDNKKLDAMRRAGRKLSPEDAGTEIAIKILQLAS